MFNLSKILTEADALITTFPQREALLRKAAMYFEQGMNVLRQAGYDPASFTMIPAEAEPVPLPPHTPDVPEAVLAENERAAILADPSTGATVHPSNLAALADQNLEVVGDPKAEPAAVLPGPIPAIVPPQGLDATQGDALLPQA